MRLLALLLAGVRIARAYTATDCIVIVDDLALVFNYERIAHLLIAACAALVVASAIAIAACCQLHTYKSRGRSVPSFPGPPGAILGDDILHRLGIDEATLHNLSMRGVKSLPDFEHLTPPEFQLATNPDAARRLMYAKSLAWHLRR
jgi:hypothetical protein